MSSTEDTQAGNQNDCTAVITARCAPELFDIIPPPITANRGRPDWLKNMPATVVPPQMGEIATFKRCLPLVEAMSAGILLPLACDIEISDKGWRWDEFLPNRPHAFTYDVPVSNHHPAQAKGTPLEPENGKAIIKWINWWHLETPKGWGILFTHPLNREDLPFRTLSGLVDTHAYGYGQVQFPAIWTDHSFRGVLSKGTPIAQAFAIPLEKTVLEVASLDREGLQKAGQIRAERSSCPGHYRNLTKSSRKHTVDDVEV